MEGKQFRSTYERQWGWRSSLAVLAVLTAFMSITANSFAQLPEHVPGSIIVKFKHSENLMQSTSFLAKEQSKLRIAVDAFLGARNFESIHALTLDARFNVIKIKTDAFLESAIAFLNALPQVEYAEANVIYHANAFKPNDPGFDKLWGFNNVGQNALVKHKSTSTPEDVYWAGKPSVDAKIPELWAEGFTGKKEIVVGIIDTGIDWDHPDLIDNIYTNYGEIPDNGIDDDGNGFVDDVHGWNFAENTNKSKDDNLHGSHCAGTIGAVGNNGIGVAGVNWNVRMLPLKFLTAEGSGSLEGAVNAIKYATKMKVNMTSNSWGGGGYNKSLEDAIKEASDAGVLFIAAAGNDGKGDPSYPAAYDIPNIIAVGASDNRGGQAWFSNYNPTKVHVFAPGVGIYSTTPSGETNIPNPEEGIKPDYDWLNGTSMATPMVSGIAALILAYHPEITPAEMRERLMSSSTRSYKLIKSSKSQGMVNAYNAFHGVKTDTLVEPDFSKALVDNSVIESQHPYPKSDSKTALKTTTFAYEVKDAKFIRLHFSKLEVDEGYPPWFPSYDLLSLTDADDSTYWTFQGSKTDVTSPYVEGNKIILKLRADNYGTHFGFKVDRIEYITEDGFSGQQIVAGN